MLWLLFPLCAHCSSLAYTPDELTSFTEWCKEYNKIYVGLEFFIRFALWLDSARYVRSFNGEDHSFKVGLNQFSASTRSEYLAQLMVDRNVHEAETKYFTSGAVKNVKVQPPDEWDWRDKGIVGKVRDQGCCSASWAFAAVSAMEAAHCIRTERFVDVSEQELIDCCLLAFGCGYGLPGTAYIYVETVQHGYFMLESDYPYTATCDICKFDMGRAELTGVLMRDFAYLDDEEEMKQGCAAGVLTAMIDADSRDFEFYESGIYDNPQCGWLDLNLAVSIVGYGTEDGKDYWIVRNSWGEGWGEKGYIRMSRNKDGQCGIDMNVCYPIV